MGRGAMAAAKTGDHSFEPVAVAVVSYGPVLSAHQDTYGDASSS